MMHSLIMFLLIVAVVYVGFHVLAFLVWLLNILALVITLKIEKRESKKKE